MGEFELIEEIKKLFPVPEGFVGIGDDCAVIPSEGDVRTLVTKDMLVEGVHFLLDRISPYDLGWKSAAVNISDVAAMGGRPEATFLSLSLPASVSAKPEWLRSFIEGYRDLSSRYDCPLLGGDTTASKDGLCIDVTVLGKASSDNIIYRSGARPGDLICVSGCLGDSGAGLRLLQEDATSVDEDYLLMRHYRPVPRVEAGLALASAGGVHSMMDISDGIASDLGHILKASGVGAEVECDAVPVSEPLRRVAASRGWDTLELALELGEDYELLFTIDSAAHSKICAIMENLGLKCHIIGRIVEAAADQNRPSGCIYGTKWIGTNRDFTGFRHF